MLWWFFFWVKHWEYMMKYVSPLNLFRDLLKREVSERGRFLGLDVGDKYVGLAVSDSNNKIASQLCVLLRNKKNIDLMADDFQSLISKFNLKGFIVGCPFNRNLNENDAVQVKRFIYELCKTGKLEGLEYTYFDESYTSKNVEIFLKPLILPPQFERKALLDKIAAVEILQDYLDYVNRKVNSEAIE